MDNRFHYICPGRSSGLQIIPLAGPAFPSFDYGQWHHAAGKSLLTAPVQRYGFSPYSLFAMGENTHNTRQNFQNNLLSIANFKLQQINVLADCC
jgi:hypothetical protein